VHDAATADDPNIAGETTHATGETTRAKQCLDLLVFVPVVRPCTQMVVLCCAQMVRHQPLAHLVNIGDTLRTNSWGAHPAMILHHYR